MCRFLQESLGGKLQVPIFTGFFAQETTGTDFTGLFERGTTGVDFYRIIFAGNRRCLFYRILRARNSKSLFSQDSLGGKLLVQIFTDLLGGRPQAILQNSLGGKL
jgi:hypothetical protein